MPGGREGGTQLLMLATYPFSTPAWQGLPRANQQTSLERPRLGAQATKAGKYVPPADPAAVSPQQVGPKKPGKATFVPPGALWQKGGWWGAPWPRHACPVLFRERRLVGGVLPQHRAGMARPMRTAAALPHQPAHPPTWQSQHPQAWQSPHGPGEPAGNQREHTDGAAFTGRQQAAQGKTFRRPPKGTESGG